MPYLEPEIKLGYNPYLTAKDSPLVNMDVGLIVLDAGMEWENLLPGMECALLLFEGQAEFAWGENKATVARKDPFREEAYCLHVPRGTRLHVKAVTHCEIYFQATDNERDFPARLYGPKDVMVQKAGNRGELGGAMRRNIKTFFDYESAPYSNMVLGEVLNFPGKWSSYPPHHHPQPEVYFHRFDYPQGFGASFANGEVYTAHNNGLTVILNGFHSQAAAPGYCECYAWGIRHLEGDPWRKTRIDDKEHAWLWEKDANDHIFDPEVIE